MQIKIFNNPEALMKLLNTMSAGILPTLRIFFFTLLLSMPLGMALAAGRVSKHKVISSPIGAYIYVIRSTPLMLQLLFSYVLISQFKWNPFLQFVFGDKRADFPMRCIILMFSLNYAAYFAEIFRGGIQSIPVGQKEAAKVLGYKPAQAFFRIQLPQIFKTVMPMLTNEFVTLVKDTSIASVVAVAIKDQTILEIAKKQVSSQVTVEPYFVVLIFFLLFNGLVEQTCRFIERKMSYYR